VGFRLASLPRAFHRAQQVCGPGGLAFAWMHLNALEPFAASQPTAFSHLYGASWRFAAWLSSAVSQRYGALRGPAFSETNAMPPHVSCASP
jgi:hypothetical protein